MAENKPRAWTTISKRTLLDLGEHLSVESHTIRLPDGGQIEDWAWVRAPNAAIVLAETHDHRFICFRQTKYAVEGTSLAPVGGRIDNGESPLEAAKRELLEETGYASENWIELGGFVLEPNRGVATAHLFLARDAHKVTDPDSDDLEDQQLLLMDIDELGAALDRAEFKVITWAAVVSLSLRYLAAEASS